MKKILFTLAVSCALAAGCAQTVEPVIGTGNPYLPLWEHLPDGEPRVFEDPDNPGQYRAYIIGSHDLRVGSYCGPDIRMWSAPVEDLTAWVDEGPIFTYNIDNQWDVMYAPDLVEVNWRDGKREYYLYPHSRGWGREALIAKSDRPDGPFTVVNATEDGRRAVEGSILGFDPSIYVEQITDPKDPDYNIGFRAYGYWGFQRSSAVELDQNTMYSARPGGTYIPYFIPASFRYGVVRKVPGVTEFPALYKDQKPEDFNFFEASSIRKVGNKYVMIFSGYSGPDYGVGSSNSTLRYAYGDSPLGPWRSGGVLVDSRGIVLNQDGTALTETNSGHNTHGSIEQINGKWYAFYHRPPRGFGFARQPMVAPVTIKWDEKPVAEGGTVVIRGYDPYAEDGIWDAKGLRPEQVQGYGLGVMNSRAAYYAKQDTRFTQFLTEGRAYGPHGSKLVIADSVASYHHELSMELTQKTVQANLEVRALGFKPYIAPALSSAAISILLTLRGEWHYSANYLGGIYMGCKNRSTRYGVELEHLPLPALLLERIQEAQQELKSFQV